MLRRTPLYARHAEAGARFVPFAGFEMPVQYEGIAAEHAAVRTGVGLFDVSHMGELRVRGPKAVEAVSWLFTNEVAGLAPGQAKYGLLCHEDGGVVDDVVVYRIADDDVLLCVNAANRDKDRAHVLAHNPFPKEAVVTDEGDDWAQIAVQGPAAEATLAGLTPVSLGALKAFTFATGTVAGVEGCFVARTGYTGEDGFELFVPVKGQAEAASTVWDALLAAGAPHGVRPIGLGARDTLRLEAKLPLYGHELTDATSPRMARLLWATRPDKPGGYLGLEAVLARKATDDRFLVGVVIEGKRVVREGMAVLDADGREVGHVTSGTRSPTLGYGVALAYVPEHLTAEGTVLRFDVRGKSEEGRVVKGPFYRR